MIKLAFMVKRVPTMTFDEFVDYHRNHHAPLFASIPESKQYVRKYTVSHPIPADGYQAPAYDGLTEIWFDDWATHDAFFSSANYKTLVQPDEANLVAKGSTIVMVASETRVV
jgi:uncharacterized protein (TIGR02118 family)